MFEILNGKQFRCQNLRILNKLQYEKSLPIYATKQELFLQYQAKQVLILKSNAGSGKSTQIPQYMLECAQGRVLVSQPRVIASESVAKRVREVVPCECRKSSSAI